jgi:hypothetical protein
MNERSVSSPRAFSLGLAAIFALVGGVFLILPRETLSFFNALSRRLGMIEGPADRSFFGVLAAAYMFVVTVLAWRMYKAPREKIYPLLLGQAKVASSLLVPDVRRSCALADLSREWDRRWSDRDRRPGPVFPRAGGGREGRGLRGGR